MMFLLERHLTREYPKQVLDTSKTVKKILKTSKSFKLAGLFQHLQKLKLGQACVPASVNAAAGGSI